MDDVFKRCPDSTGPCELRPRGGPGPSPAAAANHQEVFFTSENQVTGNCLFLIYIYDTHNYAFVKICCVVERKHNEQARASPSKF